MDEHILSQELAQMEMVYQLVTEFLVTYSFQILGALVIFFIGIWLGGRVSRALLALMTRHDLDITLATFVANIAKIVVIVLVGIIALGKLGISVTPLVATIGAAGLGAGLAMQGMLSNYAAGVTIIVTRPFVVGNTITVKGVFGVVKEIQLGMTILVNEEGQEISVPNKHIVGEVLHNSFDTLLVEIEIGIAYSADPDQAIGALLDVLSASPLVDQSQTPQVGIDGFGDSAITLGVRYWVPSEQFYQAKFETNLSLFKTLKANGIDIPFPQRHVTLINPQK
ncbi:mechanosensitive ion channel family protein [Ferrimonas sediminicola]|uniref:Small-conductance mechanosensitive channel n=1 Tax=Ferrimonas sediminicola TaxID=2569538 RepID=A0A4U1BH95_9GAMM|nr:mechanosensitive ion channel family protein [Ferrimonas sediminicola]TKB50601.1 mechanosensitive ion channel family protein [Ferrimonas sediminicola]